MSLKAYTSPGMPSMVESPKLGNISSDDQTQIAAIALVWKKPAILDVEFKLLHIFSWLQFYPVPRSDFSWEESVGKVSSLYPHFPSSLAGFLSLPPRISLWSTWADLLPVGNASLKWT